MVNKGIMTAVLGIPLAVSSAFAAPNMVSGEYIVKLKSGQEKNFLSLKEVK